jgi:mannitol/fructose-specific phosphotransferase system IIA component (Ntr-type)
MVSLDAFFGMAAGLLAPRLGIEASVLTDQLQHREKTRNSVLLPGLAIPHVVIPGEGKFEMLMARARKGVTFFDDAAGVQTLFVLVGTKDERITHLRVLSAIAQIVQRTDFEKDWLGAPDADVLRDLVVKAQRRRLPPESSEPFVEVDG